MIVREARLDDASAIAQVHVDTWRTTYYGLLPDKYLANLSYQKRESGWREILSSTATQSNQCTYVALDDHGQIIGFASGGPERTQNPIYIGELYAIYIQADYQRQGIGQSLILSVVQKLYQQGLDSMLVWVLADNPAIQFYRALGGQKVYEKQIQMGGVMVKELAYGWKDTTILMRVAADIPT